MTERIAFLLNGGRVEVDTDPMRSLADVLHHDLGLTGTKTGCKAGDCGSCAVRIGARTMRSCLLAVAQVEGCEIVTLEGFGGTGGR